MDSSRRAVESFWRSRMIDGVTSSEEKVTPVYKFEEITELLKTSDAIIVKELAESIAKRLDHQSPIVKQKALRLIKYAVGKSGMEFQREMQRHSVAVRQLLHYKGYPDPLKGDALNKAVRDCAQEAMAAIFSEPDNKPAPSANLKRRIEGFGNTNFHMPAEDKKSFLSEMVGLGSASIKQGLSSLAQAHSFRQNGNGSHKGHNLWRSLTVENDYTDDYVPVDIPKESQGYFASPRNGNNVPWYSESRLVHNETTNGESNSDYPEGKTREEQFLETIVTSGGVRLQPTRDAIQVFLSEAAKLDALALSRALESKLQVPQWQVRMRAVCVLESIIRKKSEAPFSVISSYFVDNRDALVGCSVSPQASLQDKANKVLSLLDGECVKSAARHSIKSVTVQKDAVEIPNLIDTSGSDDFFAPDDYTNKKTSQNEDNLSMQNPAIIDDLGGDGTRFNPGSGELKNDEDPFADVSFHTDEGREHSADIFNGMTVDIKQAVNGNHTASGGSKPELFDAFQPNSQVLSGQEIRHDHVNELAAGLSINEDSSNRKPNGTSGSEKYPTLPVSDGALSNLLGFQAAAIGANGPVANGTLPKGTIPSTMFGSGFIPLNANYGNMGTFYNQQQVLAAMAHFQHLGSLSAQSNGVSHSAGNSSPLPDIFQSSFSSQACAPAMNSMKKEETRAFDFISDHLGAARDPKKVIFPEKVIQNSAS